MPAGLLLKKRRFEFVDTLVNAQNEVAVEDTLMLAAEDLAPFRATPRPRVCSTLDYWYSGVVRVGVSYFERFYDAKGTARVS